ncbi:hypothetical protein OG259_22310 [Streptomyces sp. NBC_00250]|uniref:hypothetical protein n=1 Tax=Streptomyces sp. NBC_00250 TaxID=2903641 RepID=UPI002E2B477F|nr:hypothetical protein [Streptomyces sp. NBC_00250]
MRLLIGRRIVPGRGSPAFFFCLHAALVGPVPPHTTADAARAAMARAVHADNVTQAAEILLATLPEPVTDRKEST